jgi:predicted O-methyltransferase YrrM
VNKNITNVPERWHPKDALAVLTELANGAGVVVEIGSWLGHSALALADQSVGKVYCVDHWLGNGAGSGTGPVDDPLDLYERFLENVAAADMSRYIVPLYGDSAVVCKLFAHKPIDLLYIDGDHSYEGVTADLKNWGPLVRSGGIICGDDYGEVKQAVHQYFDRPVELLATRIWKVVQA